MFDENFRNDKIFYGTDKNFENQEFQRIVGKGIISCCLKLCETFNFCTLFTIREDQVKEAKDIIANEETFQEDQNNVADQLV